VKGLFNAVDNEKRLRNIGIGQRCITIGVNKTDIDRVYINNGGKVI